MRPPASFFAGKASMTKIILSKAVVAGAARYQLLLKGYVEDLFHRMQAVRGAGWDAKDRCWYVPATDRSVRALRAAFTECNIDVGESNLKGRERPKVLTVPASPGQTRRPNQVTRSIRGQIAALPAVWRSVAHRTEEQLMVQRYRYTTIKSYLC